MVAKELLLFLVTRVVEETDVGLEISTFAVIEVLGLKLDGTKGCQKDCFGAM